MLFWFFICLFLNYSKFGAFASRNKSLVYFWTIALGLHFVLASFSSLVRMREETEVVFQPPKFSLTLDFWILNT